MPGALTEQIYPTEPNIGANRGYSASYRQKIPQLSGGGPYSLIHDRTRLPGLPCGPFSHPCTTHHPPDSAFTW